MKYFDNLIIARGYKDKKPYFHPIVINKIKKYLKDDKKVENALDVGCGTGLSTTALKSFANNVVGVDISKGMIDLTKKEQNVRYLNCPAEELPFGKDTFNLITLSGSINWINKKKFFAIARNILLPRAYLIIYDNYFLGKMKENRGFKNWYDDKFLNIYPKPFRNEKNNFSKRIKKKWL